MTTTADTRTGVQRIADERARQIEKRGWTADHDDAEHTNGELSMAAACYAAAPERVYVREVWTSGESFTDPWPWRQDEDARPYNGNVLSEEPLTGAQRIRLLEKAGALIAAEIDRILRRDGQETDP